MRYKKIVAVFAVLFIFYSCKKQPAGGSPTQTTAVDIYTIGSTYNSKYGPVAIYLKNGVAMHFADSTTSVFRGVAVQGNDVYIVGYKTTSNQELAICWKNGVPTTIATGTIATGIAISGNDVYISGEAATGSKTPIGDSETMPLYWKNGVRTDLPGGVYGGSTRGITVQGNDVYVAGYQSDFRGLAVATYWKNTTPTNLLTADSPTQTYANNVVVNGNDVYVCANYGFGSSSTAIAIYWKNGVAVAMGTAGPNFSPYNIGVQGSDVYVAGGMSGQGVYVKNGVTYHLADRASNAATYNVAFFNNDVYLGGVSTNASGASVATVWKNGSTVMIAGQQSSVLGLAVAAQ